MLLQNNNLMTENESRALMFQICIAYITYFIICYAQMAVQSYVLFYLSKILC